MYSPKIGEKQIKELYQLKVKTKIPMTELVEEAVADLLKKYEKTALNDPKRSGCLHSKSRSDTDRTPSETVPGSR